MTVGYAPDSTPRLSPAPRPTLAHPTSKRAFRPCGSLRLHARLHRDRTPLLDVDADQLAQLVGGAQLDSDGVRRERAPDLGLAQNGVDLAVEARQQRGR